MKTLCLRVAALTILLNLATPRAAWTAVSDGVSAEHGDALGRGGGIGFTTAGLTGVRNPAGSMQPFGRAAPVERGRLFDDSRKLDAEGRFDHDGRRPRERRFVYPLCYAYAYCPSPLAPCIWQGGYWTTEPVLTDDGFEVAEQVWVPPGCY